MEQIRRIGRPCDVPDQGLLCDLLWSDPDKEVQVVFPISFCPYIRLSMRPCPLTSCNHEIFLLLIIGGYIIRFWGSDLFLCQGWGENDRGVSYTFGADVVQKFLNKHDMDLIARAHQVVGACLRACVRAC